MPVRSITAHLIDIYRHRRLVTLLPQRFILLSSRVLKASLRDAKLTFHVGDFRL